MHILHHSLSLLMAQSSVSCRRLARPRPVPRSGTQPPGVWVVVSIVYHTAAVRGGVQLSVSLRVRINELVSTPTSSHANCFVRTELVGRSEVLRTAALQRSSTAAASARNSLLHCDPTVFTALQPENELTILSIHR